MIAVAIAAALAVQAAPAPPADPAAAEIVRLEKQWGAAFVARDFDMIERIVAPEYRLVSANPKGQDITHRAQWMKNARAFAHHAFEVETVDVNVVGDTAVASARGMWTVAFKAGDPPMARRFFVTDTWIRRGGQWQVIHRYSNRLGTEPAALAKPAAGAERGR